jgi:hypothetical protein
MKRVIASIFAVLLAFIMAVNVSAQTAETIWLTANTTAYKTGETVLVTLNAASNTPVQGFTFQIRYDPDCLRPVNASSPIPGMNGLPLPQITGLVDGSYASVSPQTVNGVLAEVRFMTLGGCQTNLTLESAALAVRTAEGFAAPLAGMTIGGRDIALNIDKEVGVSQPPQQESGSVLALNPPPVAEKGFSGWGLGLLLLLLIAGVAFGAYRFFQNRNKSAPGKPASYHMAALHIKHGPHAGESIVLRKLPCQIGRDPQNDICINDPHIVDQHAKIVSTNTGYYLMSLGGATFLNGRAVGRSSAALKPGDVVRLGKSALFVFG